MERIGEEIGRVPRGVDGTDETRPGVPRELLHLPDPGAHWEVPEQQADTAALARSGVRRLTPVFGTGQPPRLASGAVRRLAYRVPDHRATHWVLLLAADRLDVLEHRLGRGLWALPVLVALGLGYVAVARSLRR